MIVCVSDEAQGAESHHSSSSTRTRARGVISTWASSGCPRCGSAHVVAVRPERHEVHDHAPAPLVARVRDRPVAGSPPCDVLVQPPLPTDLTPKLLATPRLLAHILCEELGCHRAVSSPGPGSDGSATPTWSTGSRGAAEAGTSVGTLGADHEAGADPKATLDNPRRGPTRLNADLTPLQ